MRRTVLILALVALSGAVPAAQQLRFTTHIEARQVARAPSPNPIVAQLYDKLRASMQDTLLRDLGGAPYDITTVLSDKALWLESSAARQGFPAGSVVIVRPDRQLLVIHAETRTYSMSVSNPVLPRRASVEPEVSWRRTGESDQVAGVRVERMTFEMTFAPPDAERAQALAGEPVKIVVNGDAWLAPQYASYASMMAANYPYAPYSFPLLAEVEKQGFLMRLVLRSELFGGFELERRVTRIVEEPAASDLFRAPDGYREVFVQKAEIQKPEILSRVQPAYTPEALRAKIAGSVMIEATVNTDGTVQDARVLRSLDSQYGLDEQALTAVRQWRFKPGTLDGKPVSVRVTVEVSFAIKAAPTP